MKPIPTAEEFIYTAILKDLKTRENSMPEKFHESAAKISSGYEGANNKNIIAEAVIEFAKLHVEAQAKAILEKVNLSDDKWDLILNAYPLTNIK